MSTIKNIAPHVWWAFEQVQAKFPQATFKIRWDAIAEAFIIATDDSELDNSQEYSHFTWQIENEIAPHCPYLLYFIDDDIDLPDYNADSIDIDVEKYTMGAPKELDEPRENGVNHSTEAQ